MFVLCGTDSGDVDYSVGAAAETTVITPDALAIPTGNATSQFFNRPTINSHRRLLPVATQRTTVFNAAWAPARHTRLLLNTVATAPSAYQQAACNGDKPHHEAAEYARSPPGLLRDC